LVSCSIIRAHGQFEKDSIAVPLGFFDVQGNVYTWCQESLKEYPDPKGDGPIEDKEDGFGIVTTASRLLRGGSFLLHASNVRSAHRNQYVPTNRNGNVGFRPARTFAP
jgi:formylglycine-generating enzyme required for sulfatase activity